MENCLVDLYGALGFCSFNQDIVTSCPWVCAFAWTDDDFDIIL